MQSWRGFLGSAVLLLGVPAALVLAILFGGRGASETIHAVLGLSFLLLAICTFDFRLPRWMVWPAFAGIGILGLIFLLQGISEVTHSAALSQVAYGILGQSLEKVLGYVFLLWALTVLLMASHGRTRPLGFAAFAIVVAGEIYSAIVTAGGGEPSQGLKLFYLPIFLWLLLESYTAPQRE
jgi:hypothetical protein